MTKHNASKWQRLSLATGHTVQAWSEVKCNKERDEIALRISRRSFLFSAAMVIGAAPSMPPFKRALSMDPRLPALPDQFMEEHKVGPLPALPPLPPRPYPYTSLYLFADGKICGADGFSIALWLHFFAQAGYARKIPYGLIIETDEQKLWLLGRNTFSPRRGLQDLERMRQAHRSPPHPLRRSSAA